MRKRLQPVPDPANREKVGSHNEFQTNFFYNINVEIE